MKRVLLILITMLACVGCDQATKSIAKSHLSETQAVTLLAGSVKLQIAKNYGAFLSLGASTSPALRSTLFSVGVALMLLAMLVYCLTTKTRNPTVVPALTLIIGGGLSNLLDRLMYGGYVVDFLNMGVDTVRTGIFNVADMFIVSGVLLLIFSEWLGKRLSIRSLRR